MNKESFYRFVIVVCLIAVALLGADLYALHVRNSRRVPEPNSNNSTSGQNQTPSQTQDPDTDASGCYTAEAASKHEGQSGCVDFKVGYTYTSSRGNKFIDQYQDYSSGFSVYIPSTSAASNVDLSQFENKEIKVGGDIENYQGAPEIIVTGLSQIKIYQ